MTNSRVVNRDMSRQDVDLRSISGTNERVGEFPSSVMDSATSAIGGDYENPSAYNISGLYRGRSSSRILDWFCRLTFFSLDVEVFRIRKQRDGTWSQTLETLSIGQINQFYDFQTVYRSTLDIQQPSVFIDETYLAIRFAALDGLQGFRYDYYNMRDLKQMCDFHGIKIRTRAVKSKLIELIQRHRCNSSCNLTVYSFKVRRHPRTNFVAKMIQRTIHPPQLSRNNNDLRAEEVLEVNHELENALEHLDINCETEKSIINEWQREMGTDKLRRLPCAICAARTPCGEISVVSAKDANLELLRNDELPIRCRPSSYNIDAYKGAILHPEGLQDRWRVSNLQMCGSCYRSLIKKNIMPKLALANWLYYGYDTLPSSVREAFSTATPCDLMMIARARSSRLTFRFNQVEKTLEGEDDAESSGRVPSQSYIKGNILVMPQDAASLTKVLPPSPETVADSICVVFVGATQPSKETISRLHPVMVRKSRIQTMINFLVTNNVHYKPSATFQGFSQTNLNSLLASGQSDHGIPCSITIGHIDNSPAIEGATAGYNPRNDLTEVTIQGGADNKQDILMDNVGYTTGDESPRSYKQMKLRALAHCQSGNSYIKSQASSDMIPDFQNPFLLSWLFPHLDPWGIGGFYDPRRKRPLNLTEQLHHMLLMDGTPFQKDPNFAFTYYNIQQKKRVSDEVRFKVPKGQQDGIIRELTQIDVQELEYLRQKFDINPLYKPSTDIERSIMKSLTKVNLVGHDIPGSAGYKVRLRNEIRALIHHLGSATLFLTINPSDINHPLVRLLAGEDINLEDMNRGEDLNLWRRGLIVANNPSACALFFDTMIRNFIRIVLRHGREQRGLFGYCDGYYGTVEAQGRGTLHCHILIWLRGHPSPQVLRDRIQESDDYKKATFAWLESVIKCELPSDSEVVSENGDALIPPKRGPMDPHPGTIPQPRVDVLNTDEFSFQFNAFVENLAIEFNWHIHTSTCWKYLKVGQPRDDSHCRLRMNGVTRAETTLDDETGSILLRRLHPRIASYNPVLIFLLQCNNDIKFIGSGEAAKALLYYITDYVTKPSLTAHVGLAALSHAIQTTTKKYPDISDNHIASDVSRRALTSTVNYMMSRREISHQQVMSYLVGGGDYYTSHSYAILHWGGFSKLVDKYEKRGQINGAPTPPNDELIVENEMNHADDGLEDESEELDTALLARMGSDNVGELPSFDVLSFSAGSISASNQQYDYLYRPKNETFENMCLYDFVRLAFKAVKAENKDAHSNEHPEDTLNFSSRRHPQYGKYTMRLREQPKVPVVLGETIARPDKGENERNVWARQILIMFKPWRHPSDLKRDTETWTMAYENYESDISTKHHRIISNMNVLAECRDARSDHVGLFLVENRDPRNDLEANNFVPSMLEESFDIFDVDTGDPGSIETEHSPLDAVVGKDCRMLLDQCFDGMVDLSNAVNGSVEEIDGGTESLAEQRDIMKMLKRKRRPEPHEQNEESGVMDHHQTRRARLIVERLPEGNEEAVTVDRETLVQKAFEDVCLEMKLTGNGEQMKALRIVADHLKGSFDQLKMYIGGLGGTGKSWVIKSIEKLFQRLNRRDELLLSAPTGIAAILIGGHTIHSLTLLPEGKGKRDLSELKRMWARVRYLIIDEVSMIGARLLYQISKRLKQAKGDDPDTRELPFGGINIIFTGDFGQLKPVNQEPLFSNTLINNPSLSMVSSNTGIDRLSGAFLWRQVGIVVQLTKNVRQDGDLKYGDFLKRLRMGSCIQPGALADNRYYSDLQLLNDRLLDRLRITEPDILAQFRDAPVIVGSKKIRDVVNQRLLRHHAKRLGQEVHLYHSKDYANRQRLTGDIEQRAWRVSSTESSDALGKLPLFVGMRVMITENVAISKRVVNGAEGIVTDIKYVTDPNGKRNAIVVYVQISGAGQVTPELAEDIVPIFPQTTSFKLKLIDQGRMLTTTVSRVQLPLVPAYCYTDYKSQGRSLDRAIVDLASARSLQGVYVMLSRVRTLHGIAIMRLFPPNRIYNRLSQDLRTEMIRLDELTQLTN